jgi:hypothetical protein
MVLRSSDIIKVCGAGPGTVCGEGFGSLRKAALLRQQQLLGWVAGRCDASTSDV